MDQCDHRCEECLETSRWLNDRAQEIRGWAETATDLLALDVEMGGQEEDGQRRVTIIAAVDALLTLIRGDTLTGACAIEGETSERRKKEPAPTGPMPVPA